MIVLIQRVAEASVSVEGRVTGAVGRGLLALVCGEPGDTPAVIGKLARKTARLRIFEDEGLAAFNAFVTALRGEGLSCPTGEFGAHMRVSLVNDGPATFSLHLRADGAGAD